MPSTVEVMAQAFKDAGTPFIVGHPGGESVELMEASHRLGMRFILVKQESAGAMLAATWGDLTGSPGVCLSTRAPGAANMVNGVTHAWMDRSPLIAITDQYGPATYATGLRQRLDQLSLYDSVTKWNATVSARTVRHTLRRAMRVATAPPPGPVQLDLPSTETLQEAADLPADVPLLPELATLRPDRASLKPVLEMLGRARRPIILAGLGVLWERASTGVVALAEHLGAPVLTTTKAKGLMSEDHPLRAGAMIGGLIEREIISQSDLIVAVGLDAVELQPKPWPYSAPVLALNSVQSTDALVPASPELVGKIGPMLASLVEFAPSGSGWGEAAARSYRQQLADALNVPSTGSGLVPSRLVEIAREILPRETVASCDAGASRLLVVQKWESYGPREFLTSNGLATMGYAIPGGMAAKLAHPQRPVVCFTGDGGFLMAVAELHTAVREKLPIIVVVFDDQEIGLIRVKQEIKGMEPYGIELGGIDWEHIAKGVGADGITVETDNALSDALSSAVRSERPVVIGARIDKSGYVAQFNALREL
ncbi:MAG: thiamine pyrophosphate-binding protein [Chloroflexota bacterium]